MGFNVSEEMPLSQESFYSFISGSSFCVSTFFMPLLGCGSRIIYTELGHEMHKHVVREGKILLSMTLQKLLHWMDWTLETIKKKICQCCIFEIQVAITVLTNTNS